MPRLTLGRIGGALVVVGLAAIVVGGALGGWNGPTYGSVVGPGNWMGPGMMGAWGGGTVGQAPSAGSMAGPSGTMVHMSGAQFAPAQLTVAAGTTVTFINDDDEPHTVTAADGSWSTGHLAPGVAYSRTFTSAGTYSYVCLYHPWMQATVTVR